MDVSLYDYLYNYKETEPTEVKFTDAGRQVFGGGGIAPDVMISPPTPNAFRQSLLQRNIFFPYRGGVGSFTTYFLGTKPGITEDLVVDDDVIALFRNRLDQEKISYTEEDFNSNLDWIKRQIRKEAFLSVFGLAAAIRLHSKMTCRWPRPSNHFRKPTRSMKTCVASPRDGLSESAASRKSTLSALSALSARALTLATANPFATMNPLRWAASSVGRAPRSQRGGREFESRAVHQLIPIKTGVIHN